MGDHVSTVVKVMALLMSTMALAATAGPCSTTYKFMEKGIAIEAHAEIEKNITEIEKGFAILESKQEAIHDDLKIILDHILRSKQNGN